MEGELKREDESGAKGENLAFKNRHQQKSTSTMIYVGSAERTISSAMKGRRHK